MVFSSRISRRSYGVVVMVLGSGGVSVSPSSADEACKGLLTSTAPPQITLKPDIVQSPHTTEFPQITELPFKIVLNSPPQITESPQMTESPHTTVKSRRILTFPVIELKLAMGDSAGSVARSVLASAALMSRYPAPTAKISD